MGIMLLLFLYPSLIASLYFQNNGIPNFIFFKDKEKENVARLSYPVIHHDMKLLLLVRCH